MMTYRVGACATPSAGKAMAEYYLAGTLKTEPTRAAEYYSGAEAREDRAAEFWWGAVREGHLAAGGTVAELRPDISPALAARLGIANPDRPLTQAGIANLLNATRLDGEAIAGRKKHTATRSVAEMFGLDPKQPPSAEAIGNVLAGRRADGSMPQTEAGKALPSTIVEGARKRFKAAIGVPAHREATAEEIEHLQNSRLATGADRSGARRPPRDSPPCGCRHDGLCRDASRCCAPRPGRRGGGRDRRTRVDQLPALHRAAGRRYRAAGQGRPGLHRHPRGAAADGGSAASHPCNRVQ
jgi:hypothetical protein